MTKRVTKWLTSPLVWLLVAYALTVVMDVIHWRSNRVVGEVAVSVQGIVLTILVIFWLRWDAYKRNVYFPMDMAFFVPVLSLVYIWHSRGWRGYLFLLGLIAVCAALETVRMIYGPGLY